MTEHHHTRTSANRHAGRVGWARPRTRRTAPIVLAAALLAATAGACGDSTATAGGVVESSVDRSVAAPGSPARGGEVVRHVAVALYPAIADEAGLDNVAYSPASIAVALGMSRAGAEGESARQLDAILGTSGVEDGASALNGLDLSLVERNGTRQDDRGQDAEITLSMANSLWAQQGSTWETPFLDVLKRDFGVGVHTVDYEGDAPGARRTVNGWVADRTHDHIEELIPDGVFNDRTRLTLVNALYLAAPWDRPFDDAPPLGFTTAAGPSVSAPAMRSSRLRLYRTGAGWQAVTIPYAGNELAMTILVPDAGQLGKVEAGLDDRMLAGLTAPGEADRQVDLTLPKWDLASRPDLTSALKASGVVAPFETERDFRPMSTDPDVQPLRLAAVVHQATVTVDERGTVAAAATAAVFETVGAPITDKPPVTLRVDRPFLFVIHDVATGAPLFVGRVTDPTRK